MMRSSLYLLAVLAFGSRVAAQTSTPRLPPAIEASVNRIADSARARGLPAEPLFAKAAEGVLKGADSTRILDAVRGLARDLGVAREALGSCGSSTELVPAASLVHAGVTPAQLSRLSKAAGDCRTSDRLVMPFVVLADLVARHVTADVAVSSIETLVLRGAPDAQIAELRAAVERDIANGQRPDAAAQLRSAAVLRTLEPRPASRPPAPPGSM